MFLLIPVAFERSISHSNSVSESAYSFGLEDTTISTTRNSTNEGVISAV
jgi:hypothetical protein